MSDNSCSGSTPFKSLVEHGSHDRSLHQDRFVDAPRVQQGFRSTGSVPSAQAQANFGAFLGSDASGQIDSRTLPPYDPHFSTSFQRLQTPHVPVSQHGHRLSLGPYGPQAVPRVSSAADAAATHTTHHQDHAANPSTATPSWAQDFTRFAAGVSNAGSLASGFPATQYRSPIPGAFARNMMSMQPGPSFLRSVGGDTVNNAASAEADFDLEMDQWMATHGDGRMEDVDTIMEQIAQELEQQQEQQPRAADQPLSSDLGASADVATTSPSLLINTAHHMRSSLGTENISRQINDEQILFDKKNAAVPRNTNYSQQVPDPSQLDLYDASEPTVLVEHRQPQTEISEAARQILQSVQHEKGDKWKNSQFLLLMKDFRDGNKDIVNNEILEISVSGERIAGN